MHTLSQCAQYLHANFHPSQRAGKVTAVVLKCVSVHSVGVKCVWSFGNVRRLLIFCGFMRGKPLPYKMNNSLNWFESPLPKPAQHLRQNWIDLPSPTALPAPPSAIRSPLSPWSRSLVDPHPHPDPHLSLPGLPIAADALVFSEDEEEELVTPLRGDGKLWDGEPHTTGRKSQGEMGRRSRPREKGLRKLSQRAFQIVQEMRNVTYKEVASKLVQQLNQDECDAENKEEQNIKRRVYDALNVLIALGVLRKDGRKIVSNRRDTHHRPRPHPDSKRFQTLKDKLAVKQIALQEKRAKLASEQSKREKIRLLIDRNREDDQVEKRIYFPFVGVTVSGGKEGVTVSEERVEIRVKEALQPFGDMDTLRYFTALLRERQERQEQVVKQEEEKPEQDEEVLQFCSW